MISRVVRLSASNPANKFLFARSLSTNGSPLIKPTDYSSVVIDADAKLKVSVSTWNDRVLIGIRRFFTPTDSDPSVEIPTKKGISLTKWQWGQLKQQINAIDAAIAIEEAKLPRPAEGDVEKVE